MSTHRPKPTTQPRPAPHGPMTRQPSTRTDPRTAALVDIIEQAIFETDTGLEAALLAAERIEAEAAAPAGSLDVAWANASLAADAHGWRLLVVKEYHGSGGGWIAIAGPGGRGMGLSGRGRTPNAALDDLARLLSQSGSDRGKRE